MEIPSTNPVKILTPEEQDKIPFTTKAGFIGGVINDWAFLGAWTMANAATTAYEQVGGWSGVGAGAFVAGSIGFAEQYASARCANTVAGSRASFFKKVKNGWLGRTLEIDEDEKYVPMGIRKTAKTSLALGANAIVLRARLFGNRSHEEGKKEALRSAKIFGASAGAICAVGAAGSELADLLGSEYTSGLIVDVAKNPFTCLAVFCATTGASGLKNAIQRRTQQAS